MFKFIRLMVMFVIFGVLGVIFLSSGIKDKVELSKPKGDVETMTADDFYKGRFVGGTIYEIWDEVAYMTETNDSGSTRTTRHYFAMPMESSYEGETIDDLRFMVLCLKDASNVSVARKMAKEMGNYLMNDDSYPETTFNVSGQLGTMSGELKKYFDEYLTDLGFDPAVNGMNCVIYAGQNGGGSTAMLIIGIVLVIVGFGGGALTIIRRVVRGR